MTTFFVSCDAKQNTRSAYPRGSTNLSMQALPRTKERSLLPQGDARGFHAVYIRAPHTKLNLQKQVHIVALCGMVAP